MNKKKTIIIGLLVFVICLGIGFAAFSTTLKINGRAKVSPKSDNYKVLFASSVTSVTEYSREDFYGIPVPNTLEPSKGTFTDDTTFTNTGVTFTEDGQSIDYKFYILNAGKYDAHITNLDIGKKTCTPGEDADVSLAEAACSSINLSVILGDEGEQTTYTSSQAISDHVLPKGTWEQIIVRISYPEGSPLSDGELEVTWNDISFLTATSASYAPPKSESNMQILSGDLNTIGSEVAIGTEHFYVIGDNKDDSSKVNLLAKYNLYVGYNYNIDYDTNMTDCENSGGEWKVDYCKIESNILNTTVGYNYQSSDTLGKICDAYIIINKKEKEIARYTQATKKQVLSNFTDEQLADFEGVACSGSYSINAVLPYSGIAYWSDGGQFDSPFKVEYPIIDDEKPYIFDNNSYLYQYVENYKNILNNEFDLNVDNARLFSHQDAIDLGCDADKSSCFTSNVIKNDRLWIFDTSYWLGSAGDGCNVWFVDSNGYFGSENFGSDHNFGVRPVITVAKDIFE